MCFCFRAPCSCADLTIQPPAAVPIATAPAPVAAGMGPELTRAVVIAVVTTLAVRFLLK
jgi:hypothetical protein